MPPSTPRVIRLWAWLVAGTTLLAMVGGVFAALVTSDMDALPAALPLPWVATAILGCALGFPRVKRVLRTYLWVAVASAVVAFLGTSEGLLDRLTFAGIGFLFPPATILIVGWGPVFSHSPRGAGVFFVSLMGASALLVGALLVLPGVALLRRWARFAAVSDLVWIGWMASILAAAGVMLLVGEDPNTVGLLPVAALVLLAGLWAPFHLAREAALVQPEAAVAAHEA